MSTSEQPNEGGHVTVLLAGWGPSAKRRHLPADEAAPHQGPAQSVCGEPCEWWYGISERPLCSACAAASSSPVVPEGDPKP